MAPREIHAFDTHVCGEPGRVITGGIDDVPGRSMLEKMQTLERDHDWIRRVMLREPRGYPAANCNLILPPTVAEADAGYVIMEQVEYPLMSGTNTIAVATVLIETGRARVREPITELTLESAAGLIGLMIKAAAQEQLDCSHPGNPAAPGITISQLSAEPRSGNADRRNAVVVSTGKLDWSRPTTWTGALDRSPCGTGTCAKMATLWAKGELPLEQDFRHEGVLGTVFTGRLVEKTRVGAIDAVVPTISGRAWITGEARYVIDPSDPFPEGFTVGDIRGG